MGGNSPRHHIAEVITWVDSCGDYGSTVSEMAEIYDIDSNRLSGRFGELTKQGKLTKTSTTRMTRLGRPAVVYVVKCQ